MVNFLKKLLEDNNKKEAPYDDLLFFALAFDSTDKKFNDSVKGVIQDLAASRILDEKIKKAIESWLAHLQERLNAWKPGKFDFGNDFALRKMAEYFGIHGKEGLESFNANLESLSKGKITLDQFLDVAPAPLVKIIKSIQTKAKNGTFAEQAGFKNAIDSVDASSKVWDYLKTEYDKLDGLANDIDMPSVIQVQQLLSKGVTQAQMLDALKAQPRPFSEGDYKKAKALWDKQIADNKAANKKALDDYNNQKTAYEKYLKDKAEWGQKKTAHDAAEAARVKKETAEWQAKKNAYDKYLKDKEIYDKKAEGLNKWIAKGRPAIIVNYQSIAGGKIAGLTMAPGIRNMLSVPVYNGYHPKIPNYRILVGTVKGEAEPAIIDEFTNSFGKIASDKIVAELRRQNTRSTDHIRWYEDHKYAIIVLDESFLAKMLDAGGAPTPVANTGANPTKDAAAYPVSEPTVVSNPANPPTPTPDPPAPLSTNPAVNSNNKPVSNAKALVSALEAIKKGVEEEAEKAKGLDSYIDYFRKNKLVQLLTRDMKVQATKDGHKDIETMSKNSNSGFSKQALSETPAFVEYMKKARDWAKTYPEYVNAVNDFDYDFVDKELDKLAKAKGLDSYIDSFRKNKLAQHLSRDMKAQASKDGHKDIETMSKNKNSGFSTQALSETPAFVEYMKKARDWAKTYPEYVNAVNDFDYDFVDKELDKLAKAKGLLDKASADKIDEIKKISALDPIAGLKAINALKDGSTTPRRKGEFDKAKASIEKAKTDLENQFKSQIASAATPEKVDELKSNQLFASVLPTLGKAAEDRRAALLAEIAKKKAEIERIRLEKLELAAKTAYDKAQKRSESMDRIIKEHPNTNIAIEAVKKKEEYKVQEAAALKRKQEAESARLKAEKEAESARLKAEKEEREILERSKVLGKIPASEAFSKNQDKGYIKNKDYIEPKPTKQIEGSSESSQLEKSNYYENPEWIKKSRIEAAKTEADSEKAKGLDSYIDHFRKNKLAQHLSRDMKVKAAKDAYKDIEAMSKNRNSGFSTQALSETPAFVEYMKKARDWAKTYPEYVSAVNDFDYDFVDKELDKLAKAKEKADKASADKIAEIKKISVLDPVAGLKAINDLKDGSTTPRRKGEFDKAKASIEKAKTDLENQFKSQIASAATPEKVDELKSIQIFASVLPTLNKAAEDRRAVLLAEIAKKKAEKEEEARRLEEARKLEEDFAAAQDLEDQEDLARLEAALRAEDEPIYEKPILDQSEIMSENADSADWDALDNAEIQKDATSREDATSRFADLANAYDSHARNELLRFAREYQAKIKFAKRLESVDPYLAREEYKKAEAIGDNLVKSAESVKSEMSPEQLEEYNFYQNFGNAQAVVPTPQHEVSRYVTELREGRGRNDLWWQDQDIENVLRNNLSERDRLGLMPALNIDNSQDVRTFTSFLPRYLNQLRNGVIDSVSVPVNLGGAHWVALSIGQQDGRVVANYQDSMGSGAPERLKAIIEKAAPDLNVKSLGVRQQSDAVSCGPLTAYNLLRLAEGEAPEADLSMPEVREVLTVPLESEGADLRNITNAPIMDAGQIETLRQTAYAGQSAKNFDDYEKIRNIVHYQNYVDPDSGSVVRLTPEEVNQELERMGVLPDDVKDIPKNVTRANSSELMSKLRSNYVSHQDRMPPPPPFAGDFRGDEEPIYEAESYEERPSFEFESIAGSERAEDSQEDLPFRDISINHNIPEIDAPNQTSLKAKANEEKIEKLKETKEKVEKILMVSPTIDGYKYLKKINQALLGAARQNENGNLALRLDDEMRRYEEDYLNPRSQENPPIMSTTGRAIDSRKAPIMGRDRAEYGDSRALVASNKGERRDFPKWLSGGVPIGGGEIPREERNTDDRYPPPPPPPSPEDPSISENDSENDSEHILDHVPIFPATAEQVHEEKATDAGDNLLFKLNKAFKDLPIEIRGRIPTVDSINRVTYPYILDSVNSAVKEDKKTANLSAEEKEARNSKLKAFHFASLAVKDYASKNAYEVLPPAEPSETSKKLDQIESAHKEKLLQKAKSAFSSLPPDLRGSIDISKASDIASIEDAVREKVREDKARGKELKDNEKKETNEKLKSFYEESKNFSNYSNKVSESNRFAIAMQQKKERESLSANEAMHVRPTYTKEQLDAWKASSGDRPVLNDARLYLKPMKNLAARKNIKRNEAYEKLKMYGKALSPDELKDVNGLGWIERSKELGKGLPIRTLDEINEVRAKEFDTGNPYKLKRRKEYEYEVDTKRLTNEDKRRQDVLNSYIKDLNEQVEKSRAYSMVVGAKPSRPDISRINDKNGDFLRQIRKAEYDYSDKMRPILEREAQRDYDNPFAYSEKASKLRDDQLKRTYDVLNAPRREEDGTVYDPSRWADAEYFSEKDKYLTENEVLFKRLQEGFHEFKRKGGMEFLDGLKSDKAKSHLFKELSEAASKNLPQRVLSDTIKAYKQRQAELERIGRLEKRMFRIQQPKRINQVTEKYKNTTDLSNITQRLEKLEGRRFGSGNILGSDAFSVDGWGYQPQRLKVR